MINAYLLGHGFILQGSGNKFILSSKLRTYVHENTMLDGRGLANLIQNGQYAVVDKVTQIIDHEKGQQLQEHLLCSDMTTIKDINEVDKWKGRNPNSVMNFRNGWGKLIKLTDDTYIYVTEYGQLTRLSDIQSYIHDALQPEPYTLHWAACRTFVEGNTDQDIIDDCTSSLCEPKGLKRLY